MATASLSCDASPPSLLLLPAPPPTPVTRRRLHAAYRVPLAAVLTRLSLEHASGSGSGSGPPPPVLVVAVAASVLASSSNATSSVRWRLAQALLAAVYSIVASVGADHGIATDLGGDEPGTVDARVVLVDRRSSLGPNGAPVLSLAEFASKVRPWRTVFYPDGEPGYELLAAYLAVAERGQKLAQSQLVVVDGGLETSPTHCRHAGDAGVEENGKGQQGREQGLEQQEEDAINGYNTVCLGGTFDHLHPGHKLLLHAAVLLLRVPDDGTSCAVIVGISGDELLVRKKYAEELQPWDTRARSVITFLSTVLNAPTMPTATYTMAATTSNTPAELHATFRDGAIRVRCVDIRDPFGPTISEEAIDAIVVSGETRSGGQAINDRRVARGWLPLDIYEIDVLVASQGTDDDADEHDEKTTNKDRRATRSTESATRTDSFAAKISSTEIRRHKAEARFGRRVGSEATTQA